MNIQNKVVIVTGGSNGIGRRLHHGGLPLKAQAPW